MKDKRLTMNYDLIVIGNTAVGRYAALTATLWEARVALVTQDIAFASEADWLYNLTLNYLTETGQQWRTIQPNLNAFLLEFPRLNSLCFKSYQKWAQEAIAIAVEETTLVKLAAKGVDVIEGKGEFCRLPKQAFIVNQEKLKARAYLIATETLPLFPEVANLSEVGYLTLKDLREQETLELLPKNLTILGDNPLTVSFAQSLAKLNKTVTLSLAKTRLFSREEEDIINLLQAQLEADGITVLTDSSLSQIQKIDARKWLQLGKHAVETDELIIFPDTQPNLEGLNLEGLEVNYTQQKLNLNQKLQTSNPKIYACGGVAGGYPFLNLAQYEAEVALKNALFFPLHTVDYQPIPCIFLTRPPLARVGLTEAQARERYGEKVIVIQEYFKTNLSSIIQGKITGLLKIVVHENGEILGGHILGNHAEEMVSIFAIAIARKIKMKQLLSVSFPSPSISEIIAKAVQQWDRHYYQTHPFWRGLRRRYFLFFRP